jgi:hypothetical protein
MTNVQLVQKSSNSKTGPMPVTTSSRKTCPDACPFNHGHGCYADAGYYTRLNWDKVTDGNRGSDYPTFLEGIKSLPEGTLWRHNVAGDLQGREDVIDGAALRDLTRANTGRKGFTYTHYPVLNDRHNAKQVRLAIQGGFTVNVSANTLPQAVESFKAGFPTVVVLPVGHKDKTMDVDGVKVVTCPATYRDDVTCSTCALCQVAHRKVVVGFPAHGGQAKQASVIARG